MTDYTYFVLRQIQMGWFLFMGLHMIFVRVRSEIKDTTFHNSFRVMGQAFVFIPLTCFIYTLQSKLDSQPDISTAINLTAYYSTFMMMSKAFLILLGKDIDRKLTSIIYGLILIFPIPLWVGIALGDSVIVNMLITVSYAYFIINVIIVSVYVFKTHHLAIKNIDSIHSEDIAICINWISKSRKLFVGLVVICVLSPALFSYPRWLRFIFMTYGIFCYCYIYYGYHSMMMSVICYFVKQSEDEPKLIDVEQNEEEDDNLPLSPEIRDLIAIRLEEWISQKGFTQSNLTVNDVARCIYTNRTYLSRYINSTYNCSFRTWITQLRIDEAKILLSSDLNMTINNISTSIGFGSARSFNLVFTRTEGKTPAQWRKARL